MSHAKKAWDQTGRRTIVAVFKPRDRDRSLSGKARIRARKVKP